MLAFPPSCTYTDKERRLASLFAERVKRLGQTEAQAGADIGYTAGSISSLLNGVYGSSPANICRAIETLLTAEAREAAAVRLPEFRPNGIVAAIHGYLREHRDAHLMGYLCGPPGIGRTEAIRAFAAENDNVLLITCPAGITPMHLLRLVASALGITPGPRRLALRDAILAALARLHGGLLLIDEADRMTLDVADAARDLWDASRCAQVWSGTSRLLQYLDNHFDSLAGQIRRRLGDILYLPGLDDQGIAAILAQYPDWPDDLRTIARAQCRGNTGRLCAAICAARRAAKGGTPTPKCLAEAFGALDPIRQRTA